MNMNSAKAFTAKYAYPGLFSDYPTTLPELPYRNIKGGIKILPVYRADCNNGFETKQAVKTNQTGWEGEIHLCNYL